MQDLTMEHADGRTAVATTPTERVTLRAQGFVAQAGSDGQEDVPSADWTHDQLDAYAVAHNIDLTGAKTKAEKVAAIESPTFVGDDA